MNLANGLYAANNHAVVVRIHEVELIGHKEFFYQKIFSNTLGIITFEIGGIGGVANLNVHNRNKKNIEAVNLVV